MALTQEGLIEVPGFDSRWVRLGGGAKAHYMTAGSNGPAVVLLHGGITGSSGLAGWRFMAPFLGAHGFRVYCPDLPGFGLADRSPEHAPQSYAAYVDFVHEFTTALCLDRFHIAGNSMGCGTTVNYVCNHPEDILSFALIAGPVGDVAPAIPIGPDARKKLMAFDGSAASMRAMMNSIIYRDEAVTDDLIEMRTNAANAQQPSYAKVPASFLGWVAGSADPLTAARLTTRGRLDVCGIPAIYLYGKNDVVLPHTEHYGIEDSLPDVQFFYPDECGHQGQTDQPEMFSQVFLEFFRDGVVSRATADWAGVSDRRPENPLLVQKAS